MHTAKPCAVSQFPGTLSITHALLLGGGCSCTYDVPDAGSLELHEAPRVFSCHSSVVAESGYSFLLGLLQLREAELDLLLEGLLS